jgi:hypothetical protein
MSYKIGETVIVTQEGTNRVGVILDKFVVNKGVMYDVLFENRSAMTMINTNISCRTYINKYLSGLLCESGMIQTTIPYKELLATDQLPIVRAE